MHTCDESQCSFDQISAEFTLEKIISLDLDKFSDSICGISGAARKELSTEQVQAFPLHWHSVGFVLCLLLLFILTLTFLVKKGYGDSCYNVDKCRCELRGCLCFPIFRFLPVIIWSLCFPTGLQVYSPFLSYIFPLLLPPFVLIPLLTPFKRSPVLVFEFSMAKLFIWPCHLSVQCCSLGSATWDFCYGSRGQRAKWISFQTVFTPQPWILFAYMCVCVRVLYLLHMPLEPYQGIKGWTAAGNDEWLPGAEVHVVITSGKGF